MQFLNEYGLFLLKLISIVVAILVLFAGLVAIASKGKQKAKLRIKPLNKKFQSYASTLLDTIQDKAKIKELKETLKKQKKQQKERQPHIYVINFHGDILANQVKALREELTAILLVADPKTDEVVIRLESPGGVVNAYGLAASQLTRVRAANLKLTVAVDKVAASGGYMMACVADQIIAAPFAIIGSIGVIAQLPNFHDYLKHKHINVEQISAGEYKRTLTMFGKNTEKGREKMQQEVDETHELFKNHIRRYRPAVDLEKAATGEFWFAEKAKEFNLLDELNTSDDYLLKRCDDAKIFEVEYKLKKGFPQKLASGVNTLWEELIHLGSRKQ